MTEQYSIVRLYHIWFVHSSVNRHIGCFHVLATENSAALNIGVCVSFQIRVFSNPMSGTAGSDGRFIFNFLRNLHIVRHSGCPSPPTVQQGSLFSTSSSTLVISYLFDDSHFDRCEVILWFSCAFP